MAKCLIQNLKIKKAKPDSGSKSNLWKWLRIAAACIAACLLVGLAYLHVVQWYHHWLQKTPAAAIPRPMRSAMGSESITLPPQTTRPRILLHEDWLYRTFESNASNLAASLAAGITEQKFITDQFPRPSLYLRDVHESGSELSHRKSFRCQYPDTVLHQTGKTVIWSCTKCLPRPYPLLGRMRLTAKWIRLSSSSLLRFHSTNSTEGKLDQVFESDMPPIWYDPELAEEYQKNLANESLTVVDYSESYGSERSDWFVMKKKSLPVIVLRHNNFNPRRDAGIFACVLDLAPGWRHVLQQVWLVAPTNHTRSGVGSPGIRPKARVLFRRIPTRESSASSGSSDRGCGPGTRPTEKLGATYQISLKCDVSSFPLEFGPTRLFWTSSAKDEAVMGGHMLAFNYFHQDLNANSAAGEPRYDPDRLRSGHVITESNRRKSIAPHAVDLYMSPRLGPYGVPIITLALYMNVSAEDWYRLQDTDFHCVHRVRTLKRGASHVFAKVRLAAADSNTDFCLNNQTAATAAAPRDSPQDSLGRASGRGPTAALPAQDMPLSGTCYLPYFDYIKGIFNGNN